ncbi:hypothetical protein [Nocardioides alcanivorans]|uniref:hypothetical protein n=1 Tax=Nocardioides alcanivorans TaxID=2897352 RepID=UPI001F3DA9B7|nr:hypothetical protein [Nocardioides alcanivorans]
MGNADTRQILADAASGVDGLRGHPYYVQNVGPGDVLVDVAQIDHPNPFGGVVTWAVTLVCPVALHDAQRYSDDHAPALKAALDPHMTVTTIRPQAMLFDGRELPVVVITGTREED